FKRIEAPGLLPYPLEEACRRLLQALALTTPGEASLTPTPQADESVDDLLAQGKALLAQHKYSEAIPFLERASQRDPRSDAAWANLGQAYDYTGRHAEGLTAYERALTLNDTQAWVWNNKGDALLDLGRPAEALAAYERALALDDTQAWVWNNKGN